jgi:tetratricopeptide (TPR) repeat protein
MRRVRSIIAAICLSFLAAPILLAQSGGILEVGIGVISPDTPANRRFFNDLMTEAAYLYPRLYDDGLVVRVGSAGRRPAYRASIIASAGAVVLNMERTSDSAEADTLSFLGDWTDLTPEYMARQLFFQKMSMSDFSPPDDSTPPILLDRFTLEYISFKDLAYSPTLMPFGATTTPEGNFIIAANMLALEFDENFRMVEVMGKDDIRQNRYSEYYDVVVTPSGVMYSRPGQGMYVNRRAPGQAEAERIITNVQYPKKFVVLSDGSLVIADTTSPRVVRIADRRPQDLDVLAGAFMSPSAMAVSPSGELWLYNSGTGLVEIFTPEGAPISTILPLLPTMDRYTVNHLLPAPDGTFIISTGTALYRFSPGGDIIWKLNGVPGNPTGSYAFAFGMAFNDRTGEILIPMSSMNFVLRLLDVDYLERNDLPPNPNEELAPYSNALLADPYDSDAARSLAVYHEARQAYELAAYYWNQVLIAQPGDGEARNRLDEINIASLRTQAEILRNRVITILENYGPETARQEYQRAIAMYEELLYSRPDDSNIRRDKERLEERFQLEEARPGGERRPLELQNADLPDVFPSLTRYYGERSWGSVRLSNPHEVAAESVELSIYIPGYMDLPTSFSVDGTIAPGGAADVDLFPVFNDRLLSLEEDLTVQARLSVSFTIGGQDQLQDSSHRIILHRKTALSWDDSGKLAAFILPNESNIQNFALSVAGGSEYRNLTPGQFSFDPKLFRAMRIIDALGARGIEYVEDPSSPITQVLGQESAVDTVRFPRTTLYYQSGDCDDTTALTTSLLEAAGIRTAILTSPGHVFAAFDSGEPEENRWLLESDHTELISYDGTLWIPIETTVLSDGFFTAWERASELVRAHRNDGLEFIPVFEARSVYPAMPVPPVDMNIIPPSPAQVGELVNRSVADFTSALYVSRADQLRRQAASLSGRRKVRALNQLGALHAAFAELPAAERALLEAIELDDANVLGYIYLTNLYVEAQRYSEAIELATRGLERRPDSAYLLLSQTFAYYAAGRQEEARANIRLLSSIDAPLADQYRYLAGGQSSTNRAGAERPRLTWPGEDDAER